MIIRGLRIWFRMALLMLLVVVPGARAQSDKIEVTAAVGVKAVYLGEAFAFQISVNGADNAVVSQILVIDGFTAAFRGALPRSFSSTTLVNGRLTKEEFHGIDYSWRLVPTREGLLQIPAQEVVVEGVRYMTLPIEVRVVPPQQDTDLRFFVDVNNTSPFVGEPITLTLTLAWNQQRVDTFPFRNLPEFSLPALKGPFRVAPLSPRSGGRQDPIIVLGEPLGYDVIDTRIDGDQWRAIELKLALIPNRIGEFDVAPVTAGGTLVLRGRSFFERPMRRFSVPSSTITVNVKPLPSEGRPAGFAGLVGSYSIHTQASPTSVNVGDPIELTVRIRGPLPSTIDPPVFDSQMDLVGRFRVGDEESEPVVQNGAKIFTRTIRAISHDVTEVPPLELAYFNVETGQYEVARSAPVPLEVRPTRVVTTSDAEGAALEAGSNGRRLEELAGGIRHNFSVDRALVDHSFTLASALRSPLAMGTLVTPPVLYAGAAVVVVARRRSSRDERGRRRRGALARARRSLREADGASAISAALREYLADRLGRPEGGLTSSQGAELIDDLIGGEVSDRTRALLERCDQAIYAAEEAGSEASLCGEALMVVTTLERELRRARA